MNDTRKSTKNLKIVFGGQSHEIDAEVLIESLINYSLVLQESSSFLAPENKVDIKIKATKEGSFELLLDVVADSVGNILTLQGVTYASALVTITGGLYQFKKWLSENDGPKEIEHIDNGTVKIRTNKGEITVNNNVYNIYQSSEKTREGLRKTFVKLEETQEIESFEIIDTEKKEALFVANKEEFKLMSSEIGEAEKRRQTEKKIDQELSVFMVVFNEKHKWEFFYNGIRIYAAFTDGEFTKKVIKGEIPFRSGDRLIVDMDIEQVFNEAANVFVNEKYFITNVKKHIPRSNLKQDTLQFIEDEKEG